MSRDRLVLIEHLGAPGGSEADARPRAALLSEAGFDVSTVVCDPARSGATGKEDRGPARLPRFGDDRAGLDALRSAVGGSGARIAVVASPEAAGGAPARALAGSIPSRWWPTACGGDRLSVSGDLALTPDAGALAWAAGDPLRSARSRLPLWDGDFVLVPLPLAGGGGAQVIAAFARVVEDEDALDLVVLGDAQPDFVALARRSGVGPRVHFAGVAPRDAEFAWWSSASAAVFAVEGPFAAGLVWRAMECGCPLLVAGDAPGPAALRAWLDGQGCLSGARTGGVDELVPALGGSLHQDAATRAAVARGRALALAQHRALPRRLTAALAAGLEQRAA